MSLSLQTFCTVVSRNVENYKIYSVFFIAGAVWPLIVVAVPPPTSPSLLPLVQGRVARGRSGWCNRTERGGLSGAERARWAVHLHPERPERNRDSKDPIFKRIHPSRCISAWFLATSSVTDCVESDLISCLHTQYIPQTNEILPFWRLLLNEIKSDIFTVNTKARFGECYTYFGCETKAGLYVFWLFFKIGLCSAISFKRSQRELSIDVAQHRSILKNKQNTNYPRFSFLPKTGLAFLKTGVCFYYL